MVRNLLLAWLLSVEDYGIASTFVLALAIVDMVSAIGLDQQIVQSKDGNDPRFIAALHGFKVLRGLLNGTLLALIAIPLAQFFRHPEMAWAYGLMALVPVLHGFCHMDNLRQRRAMRYMPSFLTAVVPPLASTLLVWPAFLIFTDARLMVAISLGQSVIYLMLTHLVAERPYKIRFDRVVMADSLRFGWPLLINSMLIFLVFNGERLIIGRELGMAELGMISIALSLTLTPALTLSKTAANFFLPQLSARKGDRGAFLGLASATLQAYLVLSAVIVTGISLVGGPFLHVLFGDKYAAAIPLLAWLAAMQGFRLAKGGSSTVAMAQGLTGNSMLGNLPRVLLLPLAWYVLATGGTLVQVIWLGILGEALGFVIALALALRQLRLARRPLIGPLLTTGLVFAGATLHGLQQHSTGDWRPDQLAALIMLAGLVASLVTSRDLRSYIAKREVHRYDE